MVEELRNTGGLTISASASCSVQVEPHFPEYETELRLFVRRVPWRLRAELVSSEGLEGRADLLVVDGSTFWDRTGDEVLTNQGDPTVIHGGGRIARLLLPGRANSLFELSVTGSRGRGRAIVHSGVSDSADRLATSSSR